MDVRYVFVTATFMVLSFACVSCFPKYCYPMSIELCRSRNINQNGCILFDNVTACLNNLLDDCNDRDREFAMEQLKVTELEKKRCPGLGEGDCFEHQNGICLSNLANYLYGKLDDNKCWQVKKVSKTARACLDELRKSCTSEYTMGRMKMFEYDIMQRDADCWFHFKYENNNNHNHTGFNDDDE